MDAGYRDRMMCVWNPGAANGWMRGTATKGWVSGISVHFRGTDSTEWASRSPPGVSVSLRQSNSALSMRVVSSAESGAAYSWTSIVM